MIPGINEATLHGHQRGSQARWLGALLGLVVACSAPAVFAASDKNNGERNYGFKHFTPYSRVAQLPVVRVQGEVDYAATYAKGQAAAAHLADFVARYNDSEVLGADLIQGGDWVLGGTSLTCRKTRTCTDEEIAHSILGIPSPEPIDPALPMSSANTRKASVLDFCNEHFAKQALGVAPIIGDRKVVNGYSHTPALPCEVAVWNDDQHIYVDMLDPNAIFSLFFTDVLFSADMQDPAFAEAISALPPQVKTEIKAIVQHAMVSFDPDAELLDKALGPRYTSMDEVVAAVDAAPEDSPYKHLGYTRMDGGVFTDADSKNVTQAIINTMSIHGTSGEGKHPTVIDGDGNTLDSILSPGSSWRSARPDPLTLPGNNHVIEACSPKYAKMAMSTGLHHVTALPCEITVQIIDRNADGMKETLVVSYLDPYFMLGALFADISEADKQYFAPIPGTIMDDLQKIVAAALDVNSGIALNDGVQIKYNMLP
jgi:uncharacterized protein (DUF302 family)